MIVTFVSQCQKKSLDITRQVLDAYANRIGDNTWQTVITQEGLNAVRARLARSARKTTAVACHRIRGTHHTELVWIVGNRRQFDAFGNVPVNRTQRELHREDWEDDWRFLPLIQVMVALSALLHDLGKSWDHFQTMLETGKQDPIRHEWVSLLLFKALVNGRTDTEWLADLLVLKEMDAKARQAFTKKLLAAAKPPEAPKDCPFADGFAAAPLATWVAWLIVTHHRLPMLWDRHKKPTHDFSTADNKPVRRQEILGFLSREMGYTKMDGGKLNWKFAKGLPLFSEPWCKAAARWANKAQAAMGLVQEAEPLERLLLTLVRLALMLGDHHYSSQDKDLTWKADCALYANTCKQDDSGNRPLKQKLDEHLVRVAEAALQVAHLLPAFEKLLPRVEDVRALRKPAKGVFVWQNKAVQALMAWRKDHVLDENGFFAVNMASTGCGKTFANAKVMSALQKDGSLRYNLALGLRTLTLQTGDEYRDKLGLDNTELAVLVGSAAVRFLHEQNNQRTASESDDDLVPGSESAVLLGDELEIRRCDAAIPEDRISTLFQRHKHDAFDRYDKTKALLYAPVVVSTIDHLMPATESTRGGRHILPTLRLMSADLVIDEVDDFDQQDMPAIGRLVHLAGMLGRKVMISSATIPPAVAQGLFHAYHEGWKVFAKSRQRKTAVTAFWLDEFGNDVQTIGNEADFREAHQAFTNKRSKALAKETPKRKAEIVPLMRDGIATTDLQTHWFAQVRDSVISLHRQHHFTDEATGIQVSLGVVRVAHVDPCIELSRYLLGCELPEAVEIRVMPYHSRQVLLLRSEQEKHLDNVLKRKGKQPGDNELIRQHLQQCRKPHLIFVLVATPVEEVGRDHDLDWAVVEPSSMRSIIQLAGRVLRHRVVSGLAAANLHLMGYNLKGFVANQSDKPVFCHPGYESEHYPLVSHCLTDLLDTHLLAERVDASLRIQCAEPLQAQTRLADLEHQVLHDILVKDNYRPETVKGWVHGAYYLSSLAQQVKPFRDSDKDTTYKLHVEEGELKLRYPAEKGKQGKEAPNLEVLALEPELCGRLWLALDYADLIEEQRQHFNDSSRRACEFLGEARLQDREGKQHFVYTPQLGFMNTKNEPYQVYIV